jgi:preprotein translocase subunit SecA
MLSDVIERAQRKIEGNNFSIRKSLLEYDQVLNEQREIIYTERRRVLDGESMRDTVHSMISDYVENVVDLYASTEIDPEEWDIPGMEMALKTVMPQTLPLMPVAEIQEMHQKKLKQYIKEKAANAYKEKEAEFPETEHIRELERVILLKVIDGKWMEHIDDMVQLRQGVGLQAFAQRDPRIEYKMQGYEMFGAMTKGIGEATIRNLFHVRVEQKIEREQVAKVTGTNKDGAATVQTKRREGKKIQPNDPCPCGSGKKYKQCCRYERR